MRRFIPALLLAAGIATFATVPQASAQMCEGTVHGLSAHYNPAKGNGFLAVRTKPRSSSHQVGELFNGDRLEIFDRKGNWYRIATQDGPMLEGWAHAKWIWNSCNY